MLNTDGINTITLAELNSEASLLTRMDRKYLVPPTDAQNVLIIHTHATEAYAGSPDFHSTDPEKSVVRVGQAIADALNARGIPTVHETSLIDLGNYNDAYPRMAGLAEDWLARYPSIQMVLDVHRDSPWRSLSRARTA